MTTGDVLLLAVSGAVLVVGFAVADRIARRDSAGFMLAIPLTAVAVIAVFFATDFASWLIR